MRKEMPSTQRVAGVKQCRRAIVEQRVRQVLLAKDADPAVTDALVRLCQAEGLPVESTHTMAELGRSCGLSVGAAVVALLK